MENNTFEDFGKAGVQKGKGAKVPSQEKAVSQNPMDVDFNPDQFFALGEMEVVNYGATRPFKILNENPAYAYQWIREDDLDLYISRKWAPVFTENRVGIGGKPIIAPHAMKTEKLIKIPKRRQDDSNSVLIYTSAERRKAIDEGAANQARIALNGVNETKDLESTNKKGEKTKSTMYAKLEDDKIS